MIKYVLQILHCKMFYSIIHLSQACQNTILFIYPWKNVKVNLVQTSHKTTGSATHRKRKEKVQDRVFYFPFLVLYYPYTPPPTPATMLQLGVCKYLLYRNHDRPCLLGWAEHFQVQPGICFFQNSSLFFGVRKKMSIWNTFLQPSSEKINFTWELLLLIKDLETTGF